MGSIVTPVYWKKDAAGQLRQLPFISGLNLNPTAGISSIYGGDTANDDLKLYANSSDARSYIAINGANDIQCSIHTGTQFVIDEVGNNFMSFDRSGSTYTTDATTTTAWDFNFNTITSGVGAVMSSNNCAGGIILKIVGDSDALTTGELIGIYGGTAKDKSWFAVIENSSDTEGSQVIIDGDNVAGAAAKPSLRIGDSETGFYASSSSVLNVSIAGTRRWAFSAAAFGLANSGQLRYGNFSATDPSLTYSGDTDTGVGMAAADALSLIAGGVEGMRITEDTYITVDVLGDTTTTQNVLQLTADGLTTGTGVNLTSTSTAGGASGNTKMLEIARSGTNSNASHTAYGGHITMSGTGTTSTNVGLFISASGATTNREIQLTNGASFDNATDAIMTIYGGDATGDDLVLRSNEAGANPTWLELRGNDGDPVKLNIKSGNITFIEDTNIFMTFNRSGSTYTTDATGTGWGFASASTTSGESVRILSTGLTTGKSLQIIVDSDLISTGKAIEVLGGSARAQQWFSVIENTSDTEGCQVIIDGDNVAGDPAKPSLRIGSAEDGFYMGAANQIRVATGGAWRWSILTDTLGSADTTGGVLKRASVSATVPAFQFNGDTDTGVGRAAADHLSLISAGIEAKTLTSAIVTTSDATLTTCGSLTLTDNIAYKVKAHVVAVDTTGTPSVKRGCWEFVGCFYRTNAGNATQQGNTQSLVQIRDEIGSLWDADFAVSGNDVRIRVNGEAGVDVNWKTTIEYMRVGE